jgi:uncharacterized membrane-anchored protein
MQRSKTVALAFLFGTLVCGGALGFTADRVLTRDACKNPTDRAVMRKYLSDRLELSLEQRQAVDSILDNRHREITRLIAPVRPQLDSARDAARAQIMKLLDQRQQQRFRELLEETRRQDEADRK